MKRFGPTCFIPFLSFSVIISGVFLLAIKYNNVFIIFPYNKYDVSRDISLTNTTCSPEYIRPYSYSKTITNSSGGVVQIKSIINPPTKISECDRKKMEKLQNTGFTGTDLEAQKLKNLHFVSEIIQEQLKQLQNPEKCSGLNFICGHKSACGMGCQIHQRIGCIMISYSLGIPFIHDENWSYNNSWSSAFLPIGSNCSPGNQTYRFEWSDRSGNLYRQDGNKLIKEDILEYPLKDGLPVLKEISDLVEMYHPNPFLWWVGQFFKFGLRLNKVTQKKLDMTLLQMNFQHPIVGIHIRRTDKNTMENPATRHEISDYMTIAEKYYDKLNNSNDGSLNWKNVFIASDDATIVNETRKRYTVSKQWNIIGFNHRKTLATGKSRKGSLMEIVLDLFLLSECDFIVCGFSSNICGALLEISSHKYLDGIIRVDGNLDSKYNYPHFMARKVKTKIIKVCT